MERVWCRMVIIRREVGGSMTHPIRWVAALNSDEKVVTGDNPVRPIFFKEIEKEREKEHQREERERKRERRMGLSRGAHYMGAWFFT
ncbi:hypothetical protein TorRG33x02_182710 [Trema orientale]|uniref:Uncharacterized protein n=1 Tax=Trema orientale TaxID=63057 RepID=A0A2P5EK41_TREOI|nr:hypothetical protein TorRG33x02_182710 [Trema orientale]